ncbi:4-hydroxy-tetrahydrodipicolinate synthase [Marinobacterium lacunae]|uniref:4-hydroxy-tetrahydrodipicolinate synthase n=1 Tax=Marinobacterium lacunae TaxID=1232683 RepID=A0A081FU41_9GAMM|nr:4-hydroxy-tetrahydrodipicolinate synthase [Marinobacterium lacunae]KEA62046.1 4-hydroxy-tetrahydrodipicolinate synthase [Marinobacterium lacunae]MBR9883040.1 4-hydroxy-tetrahydrodipicolinate synthase [Oceanospirillales bacterium]
MIRGSIVALVTPMHANGDVDWDALDRLVDLHLEKGTAAIGAVGTTGESATLDYDEHLEVIKRTVERVAGRVPVVAGTGANSTREAIEMTQRAKSVGADYSLLVTPYYNRPTQEGMYQHFRAIADAVDIPQILYNVPSRTGCDMKPETVFRLADHPNIVGIKEATGDLQRARELIGNVPSDFAVYSGDDATAIELILLGGQGNISVTANVAPGQMAELCRLGLEGKAEEARALQQTLMPLHTKLFVEPNPIPVKWAMYEMGLIERGIRLPLTVLAEQFHEEVRNALRESGVI